MPLHILIQQTGLNSFIRLQEHIDKIPAYLKTKQFNKNSHVSKWLNSAKKMNIDYKNGDYINQSHREKLFKVNIDSLDGRTKHLQKSQVNIYTDGSKFENQCGTGFAIYKGKRIITKHSERLPDESTVFQAEVRGVQKAAETVLKFEKF